MSPIRKEYRMPQYGGFSSEYLAHDLALGVQTVRSLDKEFGMMVGPRGLAKPVWLNGSVETSLKSSWDLVTLAPNNEDAIDMPGEFYRQALGATRMELWDMNGRTVLKMKLFRHIITVCLDETSLDKGIHNDMVGRIVFNPNQGKIIGGLMILEKEKQLAHVKESGLMIIDRTDPEESTVALMGQVLNQAGIEGQFVDDWLYPTDLLTREKIGIYQEKFAGVYPVGVLC